MNPGIGFPFQGSQLDIYIYIFVSFPCGSMPCLIPSTGESEAACAAPLAELCCGLEPRSGP